MNALLEQIQARADDPFGTLKAGIGLVDEDRDYLLAVVREQQARLDAAEAVAELLERYTVNVRSNNPGLVPAWEGRATGYEVAAARLRAALTATEAAK